MMKEDSLDKSGSNKSQTQFSCLMENFTSPLVLTIEYHRIIRIGKDLQDHPVRPSTTVTFKPLNCTIQHQIQTPLKHFQGGDFTTSLGNLFQCLTALTVKISFPISNLNLLSQLKAISSRPLSAGILMNLDKRSLSRPGDSLTSAASRRRLLHPLEDISDADSVTIPKRMALAMFIELLNWILDMSLGDIPEESYHCLCA
ncbi:hypothetical protein BTVI_139120 [Pitangus sulphuratus]|nr:hypothetical protein BTVI_139120 [Pitangus sulphuratus]